MAAAPTTRCGSKKMITPQRTNQSPKQRASARSPYTTRGEKLERRVADFNCSERCHSHCSSGARAQRRDVNPVPHRAHERGGIGAGANNSGSDDTNEGDATSSMHRLAGSKVRKCMYDRCWVSNYSSSNNGLTLLLGPHRAAPNSQCHLSPLHHDKRFMWGY